MAAAMEVSSMERPGIALERASWGALFAGLFVGTGTLFLLLSLGAAVGFTAVDPRNFDSWKNAGIGIGIWGGIAAIIAAFFSAWVAARLSGAWTRLGGALGLPRFGGHRVYAASVFMRHSASTSFGVRYPFVE